MATSDYGSDVDFDDEHAADALTGALDTNPIASRNLELESLEAEEGHVRSVRVALVPRASQGSAVAAYAPVARSEPLDHRTDTAELLGPSPSGDAADRTERGALPAAMETFARNAPDGKTAGSASPAREQPEGEQPNEDDARSPLERFRTAPRKPLSVTDIVSPAWCELQYWYALTKFGKKQRTPAMRQGSAVHRALEEQVHTFVPVTVHTKEDGWALRLWNVIQGLRTLRATGLTRELEIWGVLDGQVVNGIIDELSYVCADPQLEAALSGRAGGKAGAQEAPADQQTLEQFFSSQRSNVGSQLPQPPLSAAGQIYLTDVKTRVRHTLPTQAAMRPTMMQLMLYRSLFASLAANAVPAEAIFTRYGVDSSAAFTEAFVDELSRLHLSASDKSVGAEPGYLTSSEPTYGTQELQQHNSLILLWQLMIQEFAKTVPSLAMISDVLCARFVHAQERVVLGSKCFAFDQDALDRYVEDEMRWWKGDRLAKGVDIEEAYKCRICEFADGCTWRKEKIEEAVGRHRERRRVAPLSDGAG